MFSIKRIINSKHDKHELEVYKTLVKTLYHTSVGFRKWVTGVSYTSMNEIEVGTTTMDKMAAYIDMYTDNMFSKPSTILGLRKGISCIGEGMGIFINTTYKNLDQSEEPDVNELLRSMMHGFDLLMAGSRIIIHSLESEIQEIKVGVDIIDKYYKSKKRSGDIAFTVSFMQPERILGRETKEEKNGSVKR